VKDQTTVVLEAKSEMSTLSGSCEPPKVSAAPRGILHGSAEAESSSSSSSCLNLLPVDGYASSSRTESAPRDNCSPSTNSGFDNRFSSFWSEEGAGPGSSSAAPESLHDRATGEDATFSSGETMVVASAQLSEEEQNAREWAHKPRRIALFVEPSPFAYASRTSISPFQNWIRPPVTTCLPYPTARNSMHSTYAKLNARIHEACMNCCNNSRVFSHHGHVTDNKDVVGSFFFFFSVAKTNHVREDNDS
jgi:hypothetical protein